VIARDFNDADPTVRDAFALRPAKVSVAVMLTAPAATPVARPFESTVASAELLDVQVTTPERGNVVPSLKVPVARNFACVPI
jgi:hypothetical protein